LTTTTPNPTARETLNGNVPLTLTRPQTDPFDLNLFKWTGSAWVAVGGTITSSLDDAPLAVTTTATQPTVLIGRKISATVSDLFALRANTLEPGATWENLGQVNASSALGVATGGDLVTVGEHPVAVFFERAASIVDSDTLRVRRLNGSAWQEVGIGFKDAQATALASGVVAAARGNTVVAAWDSPGGNPGFGIHYRSFTVPVLP
jgi:hypothetical protein